MLNPTDSNTACIHQDSFLEISMRASSTISCLDKAWVIRTRNDITVMNIDQKDYPTIKNDACTAPWLEPDHFDWSFKLYHTAWNARQIYKKEMETSCNIVLKCILHVQFNFGGQTWSRGRKVWTFWRARDWCQHTGKQNPWLHLIAPECRAPSVISSQNTMTQWNTLPAVLDWL